MPLGTSRGSGKPALVAPLGAVYCAFGGVIAASTTPVVAPALIAYGLLSSLSGNELRWKVAAPVAALATAVAFSFTSGASAVVTALLICISAFLVVVVCDRNKMTPGVGCVLATVFALAHLGTEAVFAALAGSSLSAVMQGVIESFLQGIEQSSVQGVLQVQLLRTLLDVLWPMAYVLMGAMEAVFASVGVWLASSRFARDAGKVPRLAEFDLPLWVVGVLVASVAVLVAQLTVSSLTSSLAIMVSANVVLGLRFALALQGLGVLAWFMRPRLNPMMRTVLSVAALYLEVQFFVLTAVGLVDVWANFRHLQRGGDPNVPGNAKQDREPGITG